MILERLLDSLPTEPQIDISPKFHNEQYQNALRHVHQNGEWVENERTGKRCLTWINLDFTYHIDMHRIDEHKVKIRLPLDTARESYPISAMMEMQGYTIGLNNAGGFRKLGTTTWDRNANENEDWLANPHRKGTDDMGRVYGIQGRSWAKPDGGHVDQLADIVHDLSRGVDNRGEILNFYNPGEFHLGCLRPCLYSHQFSLLNKKLFINSTQRSDDLPLGHNFNQVQVPYFLSTMGLATGNIPKVGFHKVINAHFYEDQLPVIEEYAYLDREVLDDPWLIIDLNQPNTAGKTGIELLESFRKNNLQVVGYKHQGKIGTIPFTA
tara:strand:- start:961 stop:1929 length:969 start_codon:yes stop_codon:yes gene_type:complete